MKKIGHYIGNFAGIIIAFALYGFLQTFYFYPRQVSTHYHLSPSIYAMFLALVTVLVFALIFWFYKKQLEEVNEWNFNARPHWRLHKILVSIIGFFLITLLGAAVLKIVGSSGQAISKNQMELDQMAKQSGKLFEIMVVFVGPICEESIFRGMFFNTFFTRNTPLNKWLGILASGFVFAYAHDHTFSKFIWVYWVLGCVLAWVYMQTKDLRYSILTHMCYNALGFI